MLKSSNCRGSSLTLPPQQIDWIAYGADLPVIRRFWRSFLPDYLCQSWIATQQLPPPASVRTIGYQQYLAGLSQIQVSFPAGYDTFGIMRSIN